TQRGGVGLMAGPAEDAGSESVWVIDQFIAGAGVPLLDSVVALTTAATATTRVRLGFGVMILPLHPVAWVAKQVASLQHVSGDRVMLGVGAGGDRHDRSWAAAGVPPRERGRRSDAALRVLPGLIAGRPTALDDSPEAEPIRLDPGAVVPPIIVGGMSDAAIERAVRYGDGWLTLSMSPEDVAGCRARIAAAADSQGRPTPPITGAMMSAVSGDPSLPGEDSLVDMLTDVNRAYGLPPDRRADSVLIGTPAQVAKRLVRYAESGADRIVTTIPAGDWRRQAELFAEARRLAGQ